MRCLLLFFSFVLKITETPDSGCAIAHPAQNNNNNDIEEWRAISANHLCSCKRFFYFRAIVCCAAIESISRYNIVFRRDSCNVLQLFAVFQLHSYASCCFFFFVVVLVVGRFCAVAVLGFGLLSQQTHRKKEEEKKRNINLIIAQTIRTKHNNLLRTKKKEAKMRIDDLCNPLASIIKMHFNNSYKC